MQLMLIYAFHFSIDPANFRTQLPTVSHPQEFSSACNIYFATVYLPKFHYQKLIPIISISLIDKVVLPSHDSIDILLFEQQEHQGHKSNS